MSRNLLRDWMDGEDVDDVQFEKFTNRKAKSNETTESQKPDLSRTRKEKERQRWQDVESNEFDD